MYPRQDPKKLLAANNPAPAEEEPGMATSEAFYLLLAVVGVLVLVGGLMVRFVPTSRLGRAVLAPDQGP
jgi:farnesyl-diphosphate farnesyltransferase